MTEPAYPRKRARVKRANDGFWTPGMGEPTASSSSSSVPQATSTRSSPFASPSPAPSHRVMFVASLIRVYPPRDDAPSSPRLRRRAPPPDHDHSSIAIASPDTSSARAQPPQSHTAATTANAAGSRQDPSQPAPANSFPKAKAVVGDASTPFWTNAGGIFHPDAQNPVPITSPAAASLVQQLTDPLKSAQPLANGPTFAGISALVFDPTDSQPTPILNPAVSAASASPTPPRRVASPLSSLLSPSPSPSIQSSRTKNTVTETRASLATSSSILMTTALVTASQTPSATSSSSSQSSDAEPSSTSAAAAATSPTGFFATLGSSPVTITITVLVCVGIAALVIAFLFFFIRRCQRRRRKRRLGDILGSEFGSPGGPGAGGSGMSEWATPGPGWTDKYYGEQIGGRLIGTGIATGGGPGARTSFNGPRGGGCDDDDQVEHWQREFATTAMGVEGGYGVARTLSQERRTSEWANYRPPPPPTGSGQRGSYDEYCADQDLAAQTHVLGYDRGHEHDPAGLAVPASAAVRSRPERDFALLAPPVPSTRREARPQPVQSHSYSSYASESMYPVDEIGDVEAEKKELSDTMSALNLNLGRRSGGEDATTTTTSWRDSLDWVMGSAADLIGSKLLARGGSADTLVASPPKKKDDDDHGEAATNDRFTQRPPSIRVARRDEFDPLAVSDQFTPLSPSYGDRFLLNLPLPRESRRGAGSMSRQSSMLSLTSSANFATTHHQDGGAFDAQSARNRLFDAAVAKHAADEDEIEVLDDIAAHMMSRQTTTTTNMELPPEIPYPRFDTAPLSTVHHHGRSFVSSPLEMTRSSSASTSSSFTYRPSPEAPNPFLTPPERSTSSSSYASDESAHRRRREDGTAESRRREREARAMEPGHSMTSISTFDNDVAMMV